jgi:hypothetical protein
VNPTSIPIEAAKRLDTRAERIGIPVECCGAAQKIPAHDIGQNA